MRNVAQPASGLAMVLSGRHRASVALLAVVSAFILALFCNYNRPIWVDEFVQYAFAGIPSTREAAEAIQGSIENFNHGQTGVYMLADYWLLQLFGASAFWLRFPSLLGAMLLLVGAITFFRIQGFNIFWQLSIVLLLASDRNIMHYAGEARAYMPITGSIVGLLGYYSARWEERAPLIAALGWCSMLMGATMHPYFAPYYLGIVIVTYFNAIEGQIGRISLSSVARHANLPMLFAAAAIYVALGALTWMTRYLTTPFDPFEWIKRDALYSTFMGIHLQYVPTFGFDLAWVVVVVTLIGLLLAVTNWRQRAYALSPVLLLIGALLLSAVVMWMSYRNHYWILSRQWIVSTALCCIAIVWFLAVTTRIVSRNSQIISLVMGLVTLAYGVYRFADAVDNQWKLIAQWSAEQTEIAASIAPDLPPSGPGLEAITPSNDWVKLANQNIARGGPVWRVFGKYYHR